MYLAGTTDGDFKATQAQTKALAVAWGVVGLLAVGLVIGTIISDNRATRRRR